MNMIDEKRRCHTRLLMILAAFACLLWGSACAASAASGPKLVLLKDAKTYSSYDLNGDGKKDKLVYKSSKGTVTFNGKSQKLFTPVSTSSRVRLFYYYYDKNNVFLIVEFAKANGVKVSKAYRRVGTRFKLASEPIGAFDSCRVGKADGNILVFYTSPASGAATLSWTKVSGKPFEYEERYRVNTTTHMIVRASNYGQIHAAKYFYYNSKANRTLSTNSKSINTRGPVLKYGQKVKLERVYFVYTGTDAKTGSKIYELSFAGNKGWIKEQRSVQFVKNNPLTVQDFYKDVVHSEFFHPGEFTGREAILSFISKAGGSSNGDNGLSYFFTGPDFTVSEAMDQDSDPSVAEGSREYYQFVNTGNSYLKCAGVAIGMTAEAAWTAFHETVLSCSSDRYPEFTSYEMDDGSVYMASSNGVGVGFTEDFVLTMENGKVSAFTFSVNGYYQNDEGE